MLINMHTSLYFGQKQRSGLINSNTSLISCTREDVSFQLPLLIMMNTLKTSLCAFLQNSMHQKIVRFSFHYSLCIWMQQIFKAHLPTWNSRSKPSIRWVYCEQTSTLVRAFHSSDRFDYTWLRELNTWGEVTAPSFNVYDAWPTWWKARTCTNEKNWYRATKIFNSFHDILIQTAIFKHVISQKIKEFKYLVCIFTSSCDEFLNTGNNVLPIRVPL